MEFNVTPLMVELFRVRATLKAFAIMSLPEGKYSEFVQQTMKEFKRVVKEFSEDFPDALVNAEDLKEFLKD